MAPTIVCPHVPPPPHPAPRASGCEECLAAGGRWVIRYFPSRSIIAPTTRIFRRMNPSLERVERRL
jgi:hypothetical protein